MKDIVLIRVYIHDTVSRQPSTLAVMSMAAGYGTLMDDFAVSIVHDICTKAVANGLAVTADVTVTLKIAP